MKLNEPINTTATALVYMLDGFAEKVLERYAKAQKNDTLLRENWILQMAAQEIANLGDDGKGEEEEPF